MKSKAKWLILLFISVMMILVTGCGGEVRTSSETRVDENWVGTRTITARFSRSTFNRETKDTITSLDQLIRANCPPQLEWERVLRSGYYEYRFQLNFTSMEDYKQKVEAIVGQTDHVTIETVDDLYEEQVVLKEDIEPSDLLIWLKKALAEEKDQSLANIEKLFREYTNSLFCNGERMKLENDDYLSYTKDRHVQFNGIDFITDLTSDNLFNRTIEIRMVLDISEQKQEEIRNVFAARLPEGATGTWGEKDNQTFYQATMQNMTPQQVTAFTNAVMDSQTKEMEVISNSDGIFQFAQDFEETIDLSSYLVGDAEELPFTYWIKSLDGIVFIESSSEEAEESGSKDEEEKREEFPFDDNGYQVLFEDETDDATIAFSFDNKYQIVSIDAVTDVGWNNKFERTIVLNYDRIPLKKEQESIQEMMRDASEGLSDIGLHTEDNIFGIVVKHSGDAEAVAKAFETLFRSDSYINYEQDYTGLFRFSMPYQFEEKMNFDTFVDQDTNPKVTYHVNFLNGEKVQENDTASGKVSANGGSYQETVSGVNIDVSVVATQQSYLPIFLIVLGVIITGTVLLLIIRWIRNTRIKKLSVNGQNQTVFQSNQNKEEIHDQSQEKGAREQETKQETKTGKDDNALTVKADSEHISENKQSDMEMWKPAKKTSEITEPNDIASVRGVKKRAEIPSIYEDKKARMKRAKELEAEAQLRQELQKTLAHEVSETISEKKQESQEEN